MQKVKPLKRFGQNYLIDTNILNKIVEEISPAPTDNLIEIGPGRGALTKKLIEHTENLTSVEIDFRVIDELKEALPKLNLINGDFLELDLNPFYQKNKQKLRIVGNIPYNLTSPIIFKMIGNNKIIQDSVLMVQLEVAQRITAKKGTKEYGILAVLLQFFADVKICFKISPNVFSPRPKVYSALIHINFKVVDLSEIEKEFFIKTVKACFGNRRKTLKNSLSNSIFGNINFSDSDINLNLRAEQLEITDFVKLAKFTLEKQRQSGLSENNTQ